MHNWAFWCHGFFVVLKISLSLSLSFCVESQRLPCLTTLFLCLAGLTVKSSCDTSSFHLRPQADHQKHKLKPTRASLSLSLPHTPVVSSPFDLLFARNKALTPPPPPPPPEHIHIKQIP